MLIGREFQSIDATMLKDQDSGREKLCAPCAKINPKTARKLTQFFAKKAKSCAPINLSNMILFDCITFVCCCFCGKGKIYVRCRRLKFSFNDG